MSQGSWRARGDSQFFRGCGGSGLCLQLWRALSIFLENFWKVAATYMQVGPQRGALLSLMDKQLPCRKKEVEPPAVWNVGGVWALRDQPEVEQ